MAGSKRRLKKARAPTKVTARMVREQASQLHDLHFSDARCEELARDVERHTIAIATAAHALEFNDEPARFITLLNREPVSRKRC